MTGDPVEIRRVGPLTPLQLQIRRIETRAAFLTLELEKLAEILETGEARRLTEHQAETLLRALQPIGDATQRIAQT